MSLLIRKPGILTTLQDGGCVGHRSFGINPSGAMDRLSMQVLNTLLENDAGDAVIEMYFPAAEIVFESRCSFAIGGADMGPILNESQIDNWTVHAAEPGDTLRFSHRRHGSWAYLAVAGGFAVNPWLGSKGTNLAAMAGGVHGRALIVGDRIDFANPRGTRGRRVGPSVIPSFNETASIKILKGAEFDLLTAHCEQQLLENEFVISPASNRMGFRLKGSPLSLLSQSELVSSGVTFGTVQLLPDGQLIILMADHATTGGYPRIANAATADLPKLAQRLPGDKVRFELTTQDQAEQAILDLETNLAFLRTGIRLAA